MKRRSGISTVHAINSMHLEPYATRFSNTLANLYCSWRNSIVQDNFVIILESFAPFLFFFFFAHLALFLFDENSFGSFRKLSDNNNAWIIIAREVICKFRIFI